MYEDRDATIEVLNRVDIPKVLLSKAVNLDPRRITDFVKYRPVPEKDSARIKSAVEKITFIWNVFTPYKIFFDSPDLLESAYESAQTAKRNRELEAAKFELDSATADLQKMFSEMVSQ